MKLGNNIKGIDWNTETEYEQLKLTSYTIDEEGITQGMPSWKRI